MAVAHGYNYTRNDKNIRTDKTKWVYAYRSPPPPSPTFNQRGLHRVHSMLFTRAHVNLVARTKPPRFRVFPSSPSPPPAPLFFLFSPRDIAAYRRHVCNRRGIFFISRDPRSNQPFAGRFKKYYLSWILSARPIPGQINHLFVIDRVTL